MSLKPDDLAQIILDSIDDDEPPTALYTLNIHEARMLAHAVLNAARTDVPWLLDQVESRDKALDAVLRLADQMEAEDAAMHDFYGWPRTTTGRTDTPSERIRAAITTDLEGETP